MRQELFIKRCRSEKKYVLSPSIDNKVPSSIIFSNQLYFEYGSAESLNPSPKKLNAKTDKIINKPGIINHGASWRARKFCARWSITPQLTIGGWIPKPKKLRALSPRINIGTLIVSTTIIRQIPSRNDWHWLRQAEEKWSPTADGGLGRFFADCFHLVKHVPRKGSVFGPVRPCNKQPVFWNL